MASGPEHYREAARLLAACTNPQTGQPFEDMTDGLLASLAHGMLALTASNAIGLVEDPMLPSPNREAWLALTTEEGIAAEREQKELALAQQAAQVQFGRGWFAPAAADEPAQQASEAAS